MSLETSRKSLQLAISRARLVQSAECLVLPDPARRAHPHGRLFPSRFAPIRRLACRAPVRRHLRGDGCDSRHARLRPGARIDFARLADHPDATDLPPASSLRHLESHPARRQGRVGRLGKTRADRVRTGTGLMAILDVLRPGAGFGLLVLCCFLLGCQKRATVMPPPNPRSPVEVVLPEEGAYTGAFSDFGEAEDAVALETIEEFEQMVGKHQAIIASSSYWGEQSFPAANLQMVWRHGSLPLVFWSPWDRPYEQKAGPDRFGLKAILAGAWNRYIDDWAE